MYQSKEGCQNWICSNPLCDTNRTTYRIPGVSKTITEKAPKESKYKNKKTGEYDSKKEAKRGAELELLEKQRIIKNLVKQPEFVLQDSFKKNGVTYREIKYIADFAYYRDSAYIIEDVKSDFTRKNPVYRLKKKLFEYKFKNYTIREVS
jgi:hypothetical protein